MSQSDIAALNEKFAIAGQLEFIQDAGGLVIARISNAHAQTSIALQGAHIMTFQPVGEEPLLWLSPAAKLVPGKSIRGGIPICWPWFGTHVTEDNLPSHGFARTVPWEVAATEKPEDGSTRISFDLPQSSIPTAQWPYLCHARLTATIGKTLVVELSTENLGSEEFDLTEALHTYFVISDVDSMQITGLQGCNYLERVGVSQFKKENEPAVRITSEVDRIYLDTRGECQIEDSGLKRRIRIIKSDSHSTVVWNPWVEKSAKMGDFGSDTGYRGMVCVESGNVDFNLVRLAPKEKHTLRVEYSIEELTAS
jgi:glucose-6-phosphate 1-epimerase